MADLLHKIQAVIILDAENDGKRLFAKYYGEPFAGKLDKQLAFEEKLFKKTHQKSRIGADGDITIMDAHTIVFRLDPQVYFYVIGGIHENELIISGVLTCIYEAFWQLLKNTIDKRTLLENFDLLVLVVDETIDDGIILQFSKDEVYKLVHPHAADSNDAVAKIKNVIRDQQRSSN